MRQKIIGLLCFTIYFGFAQKETWNWHFGKNAAINFSTTPINVPNFSMLNSPEGVSSISDSNGNLLFYSGGDTIWNKNHQVMANGAGLFGSKSSAQGPILVKKPGSSNLYYHFSVNLNDTTKGLCYSIIDMNLAAGNGSVITKNVQLYTPTTEKLVATRHCNGSDIWILCHEFKTGKYLAYLLSSSGVNINPVISNIGGVDLPYNYQTNQAVGHLMKFNLQGTKLISCINILNSTSSNSVTGSLELFDFNKSTGALTNLIVLKSYSNAPTTFTSLPHSAEFSPDGSKLYVSNIVGLLRLTQFNLCAGSTSAIVASEFTVGMVISSVSNTFTPKYSPQLASDGKIYITCPGQNYLSIIHSPNLLGSACGFVENGLSTGNRMCQYGLPNFVSSLIKPPFSYVQGLGCLTASFTPPAILHPTLVACGAYGNTVTSLSWNFGDPGSGPANTSTLASPLHIYPSPGTYTVKLTVNYQNCSPDTIVQNIQIVNPTLSVQSFTGSCDGMGIAKVNPAGGSGAFNYSWTPGSATSSLVTGLSPGVYTVSVTDLGFNCSITNTVLVSAPQQTLSAILSTTSGCTTGTLSALTSSGSGIYSYLWIPGSYTTSQINTVPPGVYTLTINDIGFQCSQSKTIQLSLLPAPVLSVSPSFTMCKGETHTISVGGASSYTWQQGSQTSSLVISPTLSTIYSVTANHTLNTCTSNASLVVTVAKCLEVSEKIHSLDNWYPNPVNESITIEGSLAAMVRLYDGTGKLLLEKKKETATLKIDVGGFSEGLYILQVDDGKTLKQAKVMIKRE